MQSSAQTLARSNHQKIAHPHHVFRRGVLSKNIHRTRFCILDKRRCQTVRKYRVLLDVNAVRLQIQGKKGLNQIHHQTTK